MNNKHKHKHKNKQNNKHKHKTTFMKHRTKTAKFIQAFKASYSEYPESKKFKRALNISRVIPLLLSCTLCI